MEYVKELRDELTARRPAFDAMSKHWTNDAPHAFLSSDSRAALDNRLSKLNVNFPALVVESRVDRMKIRGFREVGWAAVDSKLTDLMTMLNFHSKAELVHTNHQLHGAAFVTVWTDAAGGRPVMTLDSSATAAVKVDRATGERLAALRQWTDGNKSYSVYYTPDSITMQESDPNAGSVWKTTRTLKNPLGAVPVVPFVRSTSIDDVLGTSAVANILELTGAISKTLHDAMVTSEYFAKPRRWATGLEIMEDDEGNAIDPFGSKRFLQSEDPDTKFGQLAGTGPSAYSDLVATLTQQVGSLTGLPPHYLGLHGDQPANAEGVRAAETQLVMRVYSELVGLSSPWAEVARLVMAVADSKPLKDSPLYVTEWESPEIKTAAQAADSAAKLQKIGVPLRELLSHPLDYPQHKIDSIMMQHDKDMAAAAAAAATAAGPAPARNNEMGE